MQFRYVRSNLSAQITGLTGCLSKYMLRFVNFERSER
jgi:hypothetical protein